MITANRILYLLINIFWGISMLFSSLYGLMLEVGSIWFYINTVVILFVASFQFVGGYFLFKKNYLLPIIATACFVLNFDFSGFSLVTTTLMYFKIDYYVNGDLTWHFQVIDAPMTVLNLSFKKDISFEQLGINLLAVMQLIGLLKEKWARKELINT